MKSLFLILLTFGFAFAGMSQEATKKTKQPKKEKPAVVFTQTVIERNGINYGADETFTFEFKNKSKQPVIVTNVGTSCGCTTAKKPEEPIKPGKTGVIVVKYDTKRVGNFTKDINVTTNATAEPIKLQIKGSVNPEGTTN
ncbi:MAG: hypothetical protein K0R65_880 [Crocinitomicaceae bacterium]|jgi:hypothetical protein|nr:hypothetical protein [Crocinitomicaceae bacterium]